MLQPFRMIQHFFLRFFPVVSAFFRMLNHPEKLFADRLRCQLTQTSVYPVSDLLSVSAAVRGKNRFSKSLCLLYGDTLSLISCGMHIKITVLIVRKWIFLYTHQDKVLFQTGIFDLFFKTGAKVTLSQHIPSYRHAALFF